MIVLAFDTATTASAVGLRIPGHSAERRDDPRPGEHPGHATRLLAMAAELLEQANLGWGELERIAVGVGPGAFTGLRVGVATARGLAHSLEIEVAGVGSLAALAHGAFEDDPRATAQPLLAVIDARRGEVFAAAYRRSDRGSPDPLSEPAPLAPERLADLVAGVAGEPASSAGLAVGDGAVRFRAQLEAAGAEVPADDSPLHRVRALATCVVGEAAQAVAAYEDLLPDYRRRPDAELALEGAAGWKARER